MSDVQLQEGPALPVSQRLKALLVTTDDPAHARIVADMRHAIEAGDATHLARLLVVYDDRFAPAASLAADIEARGALPWQDWRDLHDVLVPPAANSEASPRTLPKGLGGARNDEEFANVAQFIATYVDGGDLPPEGRAILRANIDGNNSGVWCRSMSAIARIDVTKAHNEKVCVEVVMKNGSKNYYHLNAPRW